MRLSSSPLPLRQLCFAGCLLILVWTQFLFQIEVASRSWFSQWPLFWDQNRYSDVAYYYMQGFRRNGLYGLLESYTHRPPYSLTLLLTSLPVIIAGGSFTALVFHLFFYVLLLDAAIFWIVYRMTRRSLLALLSVMLVHLNCAGIMSYSYLGGTTENIRYQINFPTLVVTVTLLALLLEGCRTKRPVLWASSVALTCFAALVLRPAALPYFMVLAIPSFLFVCIVLFRLRDRAAWWGVAALALACLTAALHYSSIWRIITAYFAQTQNSSHLHPTSGLGSLLYYLNAGYVASTPFPLFLIFTLAGLISYFLRLKRCLRGRNPLAARGSLKRVQTGFLSVLYLVSLTYILPTLSPVKDYRLGDAFIVFTISLSIPALWELWRAYARRRTLRYSPSVIHRAQALLLTGAILTGTCVTVHETFHLQELLHRPWDDPFRLVKLRLRITYRATHAYVTAWLAEKKRTRVWAAFISQLDLRYESHSFNTLPYVAGLPELPINFLQSRMPVSDLLNDHKDAQFLPELLFVPEVHDTSGPGAIYIYEHFRFVPISDADREKLTALFIRRGYAQVGTVPITEHLRLNVFESLHLSDTSPPPAFPFP